MDGKDWQLLRAAPLFSRLSDRPIETLLAGQQPRTLKKGAFLFHQGQRATHAFVILDGWIRLFTTSAAGTEAIIHIARPGDLFGDSGFFLNDGYPVSAEAVSAARVIALNRDRVLAQMRSDARFALEVMASLASQIQMLVRHIEALKVLNGEQRMAEFLMELSPGSPGASSLSLPFEKALIAGCLGMQPASLSRALARLRKLGVSVNRNVVSVPNSQKLSELVESTRNERLKRHTWRRGRAVRDEQ